MVEVERTLELLDRFFVAARGVIDVAQAGVSFSQLRSDSQRVFTLRPGLLDPILTSVLPLKASRVSQPHGGICRRIVFVDSDGTLELCDRALKVVGMLIILEVS